MVPKREQERRPWPVQRRWDRQSANTPVLSSNEALQEWFKETKPIPNAERFVSSPPVWANVFRRINPEAPVFSYEIDHLILDYNAKGLFPLANQFVAEYKKTVEAPENADIVWVVRWKVAMGAYLAIWQTEDRSKSSERLEFTKARFDDLHLIRTVIRRVTQEQMLIRRRDGGDGDEIGELFNAFEQTDVAIYNFLKAYKPRTMSGNIDYLSSILIGYIVRLWWALTCGEANSRSALIALRKDMPRLTKFLAAAWRDLQFPIEDGRGNTREPLRNGSETGCSREFESAKRRAGNLPSE